jgi:peptidoglycan/LPS O-acetylase OafA/YrhL
MAEPAITTATRAPAGGSDPGEFPCFDGLRAIAALLVAITHAGFISGYVVRERYIGAYVARMDVGVAMFFVISGFLLYRPFVAARFGTRPVPDPLPYARRRFLRIAPAYWLTLTLVLLVPAIQGLEVPTFSWDQVLAHYTLVHTYHPRFSLIPVQQAWTLATEIAFYAFLPFYAAFMRRRRGRASVIASELTGLGVLFSIGIIARTLVLFGVDDATWRPFMNLWLPARLDHFALGMLLAVASVWFRDLGREPSWARHPALPWVSWAICGASFWFMCLGFGLDELKPEFSLAQEWWLLFFWGIVGVTAVAPAVFGPQRFGLIRAVLRFKPVAWLGMISYGIYLWHEAALDFYLRQWDRVAFGAPTNQTFFFMFVFTIPIAALSYYLIERPALTLKNRPVGTWFRPTSGTAA